MLVCIYVYIYSGLSEISIFNVLKENFKKENSTENLLSDLY